MDKEAVIKLRDTLKCGNNYPLRMTTDSTTNMIDESNPLAFTKWDDTNGILYSIKLPDPQSEVMPSNRQRAVSVVAIFYDHINSMELALVPVDTVLPTVLDSIKASGSGLSDDFINRILKLFKEVLSPERYELLNADINKLVGANLNEADDYYNGKYKTPKFVEQGRTAPHV